MSTPTAVTAVNGATPYVVTLEDPAGHRWLADEPLETGGANEGPSPTARLLDVANKCPLHKILTGRIRIRTSLRPV